MVDGCTQRARNCNASAQSISPFRTLLFSLLRLTIHLLLGGIMASSPDARPSLDFVEHPIIAVCVVMSYFLFASLACTYFFELHLPWSYRYTLCIFLMEFLCDLVHFPSRRVYRVALYALLFSYFSHSHYTVCLAFVTLHYLIATFCNDLLTFWRQ